MDDGIGRNGVRLVALVFMFIGTLGVLVFVNANTAVLEWTGIGAILVAMAALAVVVYGLTTKPKPAVMKRVERPQPTPDMNVELPPARPQPAPRPARPDIEMLAPRPKLEPKPVVQPVDEPENRAHLRERYTQNTQLVKDILDPNAEATKVPRLKARKWSPRMGDDTPAGTTRGRCGQCQSIILAPTARPIDLSCPVCEKVTRLNG